MSIGWIIAGGIALLAAPIHAWGGERTLHLVGAEHFPTQPGGLGSPTISRQEIRMGWHGMSVDLALKGTITLLMGLDLVTPNQTIADIFALHFVFYALVIAVVPYMGLRRISTLWQLPQWALCFIVAAALWLG